MTLPIPPSDSLYKFTAIGGLILVVLSLYVPWKMDSDLQISLLDIGLELTKWDLEETKLKSGLHEVQEQLKLTVQDVIDLKAYHQLSLKPPRNSPKGDSLTKTLQSHRSNLKEFENQQQQLQLLLLQSKNALTKQARLRLQVDQLYLIALLTLGLGIIMMTLGFWNWYFRFQVHQDRIIKAQAEQWTKPRTTEHEKEEIPG